MRASTASTNCATQLQNLVQPFTTTFGDGNNSAVLHLSPEARSNLNVLYGDDGCIIVPMTNGSQIKNALMISFTNGVVKRRYVNSKSKSLFHLLGSVDNRRTIFVVSDFLSAASLYAIKECPVYVAFSSSNLDSLVNALASKFPDRVIRVIHDPGVDVAFCQVNVELYKSTLCSGNEPSLWLTHHNKGTRAAVRVLHKISRDANSESISFFQDSLKVTLSMFEFVEGITANLSKQQTLFLKHLLACTYILCGQNVNDYFIPVPYETIVKYARGCDTFMLRDLGLIIIKYEEPNRCREYAIADGLYDSFVSLFPTSLKDIQASKYVDLFTGKTTVKTHRNQKSFHSPLNNHPVKIPKLLQRAMDCISPRPVNLNAMEALLNFREVQMKSVEKGSKEFLSLRGKYINDRTCFLTVCKQVSSDTDVDGFHLYSAAHRVQKAGRFSEIGGGLQSASKEMKLASTLGVTNLYNYDLVSSQVNGLIQEFARHGLVTDWLENYRDDPNAKVKFAKLIGVDVATWKICLLATIMGSTISRNPNSSVYNALLDFQIRVFKNADGLSQRFVNFIIAIKPLKAELDKWHNILIGNWVDKSTDSLTYKYKNLKLMRNATGMKAIVGKILKNGSVKTLINRSQLKRELAAFILQGQEAAFIHHLTILSNKFNYVVIGNEHDGLITIGEIPVAAMQKAGELSGLEKPVMKTKELFDGNDNWTKEELLLVLSNKIS
jgi:hypothetical protein